MIARTQSPLRVILYEGPGSNPLDIEEKTGIVRFVLDSGFEISIVGQDGVLALDFADRFLVVGRFTNAHSFPYEDASTRARFYISDLSETNLDQLLEQINRIWSESDAALPGQWKPWFPAIDSQRCTNCLQCLSFCLFDVYGVTTNQQIQVQNPDKCKTDCPACSRVCPEVAIIFPKYRGGPINGDEVNEQDLNREKMKVDISSLLGGDIYQALRSRSEKAKSRFTKERDENKALAERKRCLDKLKQQLDIPDEVLSSLPSLEQIQAKALQKQMEVQ